MPFRIGSSLATTWNSGAVRYGFAVGAVVFCVAVRVWLEQALGPLPRYITLYPAVLLVALIVGGGPGVLATILSVLVLESGYILPPGAFREPGAPGLIELGIFVGCSFVLCALTERVRRSEAALGASEAKYRLLIESIQDSVTAYDASLRLTYWNPGAERLTGLRGAEVIGHTGRELWGATDTVRAIEETLRACMRTDKVLALETRAPAPGPPRWLDIHFFPTAEGALAIARDVTERKNAQGALQEADRRKDVFLAMLSHELRNPLAPIRTAVQVLESPYASRDDLNRCRSIIARQVDHMASLLDDLLDVTRITRGAMRLKKERVPFQELLENAVEAAQPLIEGKRHRLRWELPSSPLIVEVDPVRITQVVSNLLTNAAKYTDSGGEITVGGRLEAKSVALFVRDTGIGLAPEMLSRIFEMFAQVEEDRERSGGGLGVGLALVRGLVELHGGQIVVHSAGRGQGSEFIVRLPRTCLVDHAPSPGPMVPLACFTPPSRLSRTVLIADDNRDGAESLAMLLRLSGHEVFLAHTGPEALQVASRTRPQVGVLDIDMPGMNGYEVAAHIRRESWGNRMTLIAVTGWGQEQDKRAAQSAGFDHHFTKPMDPGVLDRLFGAGHEEAR